MGEYRSGDNEGMLGEIRITKDTKGHSVIRVGTAEMEKAVKEAIGNEEGVTIEKIGGEKKTCLSDPHKDYGDSLCQIAEDIVR